MTRLKFYRFFLIGILFGIIMTKAEVISWYRIQEMFRMDSFHMYGVIMTALTLGILIVQGMKLKHFKNRFGEEIRFLPKERTLWRYLLGGSIFGLGWALTGACPGPMYTLIGHGYLSVFVVLISAVIGTLLYGMLRTRLPH